MEQQDAFERLKQCLVSAPILTYPRWNHRFILFTDASTFALELSYRKKTMRKMRELLLMPVDYFYLQKRTTLQPNWSV